jgi:acyl transferase domain-containing protein
MNDIGDPRYLEALKKASERIRELRAENEKLKRNGSVAVIGMGCRFPGGADSVGNFWDLLVNGKDAVGEIPADRWDAAAYFDADPDKPGRMYTCNGAFLSDVAGFDATFFGITPREAEAMDPQQRLLLETSWEAVEDAVLDPRALAGSKTGVFIGLSNYDYIQAHIHSGDVNRITAHSGSGVMFSTAAGRLSFFYDLRGPCVTTDTACSSSLVSLHLAMQSLRNGECDVAMAGGVNLLLSLDSYIALCKVKALSPDGRCRTFDAAANGYGRGEGCGLLILKRLADAERDGDRIIAVLAGAAVNHDGRSNGLTAPNGVAQQAVIQAALQDAGVAPDGVDYVEAHGTGTALGDPIEVNALQEVFRARAGRPLLLGSVKSNIGHTEAAAGIAGVIKVILALQNRKLPPSLHFASPNQHIDWSKGSVRVVDDLVDWPSEGRVRVAGVSSFGLSGTNAHVVVTEAPVPAPAKELPADRPVHVLPLSAHSPEALRALCQRYDEYLAAAPEFRLADICYSAAHRSHLRERAAITGESVSEIRHGLAAFQGKASPRTRARSQSKGAVWLFSGQGSLYAGMGRELYQDQPVFRRALEQCSDLAGAILGRSLIDHLYADDAADDRLSETALTQPALFGLQYALAELWKSWGLHPLPGTASASTRRLVSPESFPSKPRSAW